MATTDSLTWGVYKHIRDNGGFVLGQISKILSERPETELGGIGKKVQLSHVAHLKMEHLVRTVLVDEIQAVTHRGQWSIEAAIEILELALSMVDWKWIQERMDTEAQGE